MPSSKIPGRSVLGNHCLLSHPVFFNKVVQAAKMFPMVGVEPAPVGFFVACREAIALWDAGMISGPSGCLFACWNQSRHLEKRQKNGAETTSGTQRERVLPEEWIKDEGGVLVSPMIDV